MNGLKNKNSVREYGIDLLRIISMIMVIIMHIENHGGGIAAFEICDNSRLTSNYVAVWLLELFALCGVNVFALISGYVSQVREISIKKHYISLIMLWIRVVFYSVLISLCMSFFFKVNLSLYLKSIMPVISTRYWYFTMYFVVALVAPVLDFLITNIDRKAFIRLGITCFILFSLFPTLLEKDVFQINYGYSAFWLIILYITGAGIKKFDLLQKQKKFYFMIFIASWMLSFLLKIATEEILLLFRGEYSSVTFPVYYTTPLMVIQSISLLGLFKNLQIENIALKKLISIFAGASFSVYLIHDNVLIREHLMTNSFLFLKDYNTFMVVLIVLSSALAIYVCCSLIDLIRVFIFKKLSLQAFIEKYYDKCIHIYDSI